MKGFTLFSDIFSVFVLIGLIMLASLLIWTFTLLYDIEVPLTVATPRSVELTTLFNPIKYDTTLMTLLEYDANGMPIKKILNAAAIQESTSVWIDGQIIDVKATCDSFLTPKIVDKSGRQLPYVLKIILPTKEIKIIEKSTTPIPDSPTYLQESSTKLYLLDGRGVELKLLVYIS